MSRKCIPELTRAKQFCDLLGEVRTHIALGFYIRDSRIANEF